MGEERARFLRDLAALHAGELEDPQGATRLYQEVLALSPSDRATLTALVELYTAAERWRDAVECLTRLAELEPTGFRRARYFQIAAQVARGRVGDDETAALYNAALDGFFAEGEPPAEHLSTCLRAFDDLDSYLRARGAFRPLERSYRMMIRRLGAGAPELGELWARLGDLYRDNLDEPAAAIQAHEVAASLDGDRPTRHRILISLYEGFAPDEIDKLVERRQRLLRHEPLVAEHYRALSNLYRQAGRRDHAYLGLRAVASLGAATADERSELAQLDAERPAWAQRALDISDHARIRHPDEDLRITSVLAIVAESIAAELATPPKRLRLTDDPSPGWQPLRELHRGVSILVGATPPPLFVSPELDTELVFANVIINGRATLALAAGGRVARATKPQVVHNLARTLAHVRPAYFLRLLLCEPGALDAVLDAALMVGGFRGRLTGNAAAHHFSQAIDRRLTPASRAHLSSIVGAIEDSRSSMSVQRWGESVDATCRRVALLLGGDLATAIAALGREQPHAARRPLQERLADLLVHSCSDEHAELRADLGLALP
jgi:DNA-binding SARP family transcriptional activator